MTEIRVATEEDIELINSLAKEIFPCTYKEILSPEQSAYMFEMMYAPHNIQKQMEAGHKYHIAYLENKPCGYISLHELSPTHFYIEKIYTLPAIHGKGVAKILFEFACSYSLHNCQGDECLLELNVNRSNKRAIGFYTKMGMHPDRQTDEHVGSGYYANDYVMAISLKLQ